MAAWAHGYTIIYDVHSGAKDKLEMASQSGMNEGGDPAPGPSQAQLLIDHMPSPLGHAKCF